VPTQRCQAPNFWINFYPENGAWHLFPFNFFYFFDFFDFAVKPPYNARHRGLRKGRQQRKGLKRYPFLPKVKKIQA
jgi:hypothetical protein